MVINYNLYLYLKKLAFSLHKQYVNLSKLLCYTLPHLTSSLYINHFDLQLN